MDRTSIKDASSEGAEKGGSGTALRAYWPSLHEMEENHIFLPAKAPLLTEVNGRDKPEPRLV
jgi:hypothetical protein